MKIQCQLPIKVAVRSEAVLIEFTPAYCLFSTLYSSMHCNYKWHLSPVKHSESLTLFHQNVLFVYRLKTWPTGPWNLPLIKSQFFSLGRTKREYTCDVLWQGVSSWFKKNFLFFSLIWRAWHFHTGWTSYQLYSSSLVTRSSLTVSIWAPDPSDSYNNINLRELWHEATNKLLPSHDDATALSSAAGVQYSPPTRVALVLRRVLTCVWSNTICLSRLHM